jgi:alpha-L-arabinofuranosidase
MQNMGRRTFVGSMLAAGAAALLVPRSTKAADSRIEILLNEPIGKISSEIYSHFVEHLGGVAMTVFG